MWAARIDRQCGLSRGTTTPDDLLSAAWLVLNKFGSQVAKARDPWGYLWTAVSHICLAETVQDITLTRPSRRSPSCDRPRVLRVGLISPEFDAQPYERRPRRTPLVRCVVRLLVEAGGDPAFWTEAVTRAVDVMATARRSYELCAVRSDPVLRKDLRLSSAELSALAALLIGSRRGGPSQSLLLALCHDKDAQLDAVAFARERVSALLARPHALDPPPPVPPHAPADLADAPDAPSAGGEHAAGSPVSWEVAQQREGRPCPDAT
jgi:hypothetical protein